MLFPKQGYQQSEPKFHSLVKRKNYYDRDTYYKISMSQAFRRNLKLLRTGVSVISHTNAVLQLKLK